MRRKGYRLTRYADDWLVTCRTKHEAQAVLTFATKLLEKLGVELNKDKTRIVHTRRGFEFLGVKIKRGSRPLGLPFHKIKAVKHDHVSEFFAGQEELALSSTVSKQSIDFLTTTIHRLERAVHHKIKLRDEYEKLLSIPGVGMILALTIMLETGTIHRFSTVGTFASYCRKVPSVWTSNGSGKKKSNKYLAWAFSEAAELTRRYNERAKAFFNSKAAWTNRMVAHKVVAHKLARAAYFIMRDKVDYQPEKLFC